MPFNQDLTFFFWNFTRVVPCLWQWRLGSWGCFAAWDLHWGAARGSLPTAARPQCRASEPPSPKTAKIKFLYKIKTFLTVQQLRCCTKIKHFLSFKTDKQGRRRKIIILSYWRHMNGTSSSNKLCANKSHLK